ncbi:MAG: YihY/virulence factor BrkB family protein [Maioricimonas sp. JB049]
MHPKLERCTSIVKQSASDFSKDDCPMMAAALAYYTAFALPALLVLIVTVAGWFWSADDVTHQVEQQVVSVIGEGGWQQVRSMMNAADEQQGSGMAALFGILVLIVGATGVMVQLQAALNRAWEVQPDPDQGGVQTFLLKRVLSLAMIIAISFLLLVSLVLTAVLKAMAGMVVSWMPDDVSTWVPWTIDLVVSFVVFTLLFASMLKLLPDANVRWKDTWVGAGVTAALFLIGKFALAFYFGMKDTSQYGAASSTILLLAWVYYSGMIFLFGAEFTQVWARQRGHRITPEKGAVRVVRETKQVGEGEGRDKPVAAAAPAASRGGNTGK